MASEGYEFTKKAADAKIKVDDEMDDLVDHFQRKYIRTAVAEKYYCLAKCQETEKSTDIVRVKLKNFEISIVPFFHPKPVNQCMSQCGADIPAKKTIIYNELQKFKQVQEKAFRECADETESMGKSNKYFSG